MAQAVRTNFKSNESKALISISSICLVIGIGSIVIYAGIFAPTTGSKATQSKITIDGNGTCYQRDNDKGISNHCK